MDGRYRFFRWFGYLLLAVGGLVILFGLLGAVFLLRVPTFTFVGAELVEGPPNQSLALSTGVSGLTIGLGLIFLSQLISILYGIEANTRASAKALTRLIEARSGRPRPD